MGHFASTPYARQADLKTVIQARLGVRLALWLAVVCTLATPLWSSPHARLELARLTASDRQALVARCHQQAELLLALDVCDADCRALATRYAARPSR